MSDLVLARDALVLTRSGPALARNVEPGLDVLGIHGGAHRWESVSALQLNEAPTAGRRIGTAAGLAIVADDVMVEGSGGPTLAGDLRVGDGLELVHPADLMPFDRPTSALQGLDSLRTVLPTENGCADIIDEFLDDLLSRAGLRGEKFVGGRWMAVHVGRLQTVEWSWDEEAELVAALHAWEADGDGPLELRLREGDHAGRALVLGALIASRRGFVVRATPAFSPVELRVAESDDPWPAYSPINSCAECVAETLTMSVAADRWSVIADLLILRSRRIT